jgi:hypothetical protein
MDNTQTNPFFVQTSCKSFCASHGVTKSLLAITQDGVRKILAEADAAALAKEDGVVVHDEIPPSVLIHSGMDLEISQSVNYLSSSFLTDFFFQAAFAYRSHGSWATFD